MLGRSLRDTIILHTFVIAVDQGVKVALLGTEVHLEGDAATGPLLVGEGTLKDP